MKIRKGFVSNSSSCSFVVAGYEVKKDDNILFDMVSKMYPKETEEYIKKYPDWSKYEIATSIIDMYGNIEVLNDIEVGYNSDTHMVIGISLAEGDDCNMFDNNEYSFNDIAKLIKDIGESLKKCGVDRKKVIVTGVRMC